MKGIIKKILVIFVCGLAVFGASYAYLDYSFKQNAAAIEKKEYTVPYERTPQSRGIAFVFADGSALLAYLDFENTSIRLLDIEKFNDDTKIYSGYAVDYTAEMGYDLIEGIVDRVGGVNLTLDGETLRYTGVQVIDLISHGCDQHLKRQIIIGIFTQISKNTFSKDDFVYIIENSKTDLPMIECIYWVDYIKEMCNRVSYVN